MDLNAFQNTTRKTFTDVGAAQRDWEQCIHKTTGCIHFAFPLPKLDTEKPFTLAIPLPPNQPKSNSVMEARNITISDAREHEAAFSLDVHGFTFAKDLPPMSDDIIDGNNATIEDSYLAKMEMFLKRQVSAERVHAFDYTVRQVKPLGEHYHWHEKRPPARNAHIDQTPEAAMARLRLYFAEEANELAHGRVQLLNLWRPLIGPVTNNPLAVVDARSLSDEDLIAQDMVYPHYIGENYMVKFNKAHRWYYWSNMTPLEGIIIKNFDSELDGRARREHHKSNEMRLLTNLFKSVPMLHL